MSSAISLFAQRSLLICLLTFSLSVFGEYGDVGLKRVNGRLEPLKVNLSQNGKQVQAVVHRSASGGLNIAFIPEDKRERAQVLSVPHDELDEALAEFKKEVPELHSEISKYYDLKKANSVNVAWKKSDRAEKDLRRREWEAAQKIGEAKLAKEAELKRRKNENRSRAQTPPEGIVVSAKALSVPRRENVSEPTKELPEIKKLPTSSERASAPPIRQTPIAQAPEAKPEMASYAPLPIQGRGEKQVSLGAFTTGGASSATVEDHGNLDFMNTPVEIPEKIGDPAKKIKVPRGVLHAFNLNKPTPTKENVMSELTRLNQQSGTQYSDREAEAIVNWLGAVRKTYKNNDSGANKPIVSHTPPRELGNVVKFSHASDDHKMYTNEEAGAYNRRIAKAFVEDLKSAKNTKEQALNETLRLTKTQLGLVNEMLRSLPENDKTKFGEGNDAYQGFLLASQEPAEKFNKNEVTNDPKYGLSEEEKAKITGATDDDPKLDTSKWTTSVRSLADGGISISYGTTERGPDGREIKKRKERHVFTSELNTPDVADKLKGEFPTLAQWFDSPQFKERQEIAKTIQEGASYRRQYPQYVAKLAPPLPSNAPETAAARSEVTKSPEAEVSDKDQDDADNSKGLDSDPLNDLSEEEAKNLQRLSELEALKKKKAAFLEAKANEVGQYDEAGRLGKEVSRLEKRLGVSDETLSNEINLAKQKLNEIGAPVKKEVVAAKASESTEEKRKSKPEQEVDAQKRFDLEYRRYKDSFNTLRNTENTQASGDYEGAVQLENLLSKRKEIENDKVALAAFDKAKKEYDDSNVSRNAMRPYSVNNGAESTQMGLSRLSPSQQKDYLESASQTPQLNVASPDSFVKKAVKSAPIAAAESKKDSQSKKILEAKAELAKRAEAYEKEKAKATDDHRKKLQEDAKTDEKRKENLLSDKSKKYNQVDLVAVSTCKKDKSGNLAKLPGYQKSNLRIFLEGDPSDRTLMNFRECINQKLLDPASAIQGAQALETIAQDACDAEKDKPSKLALDELKKKEYDRRLFDYVKGIRIHQIKDGKPAGPRYDKTSGILTIEVAVAGHQDKASSYAFKPSDYGQEEVLNFSKKGRGKYKDARMCNSEAAKKTFALLDEFGDRVLSHAPKSQEKLIFGEALKNLEHAQDEAAMMLHNTQQQYADAAKADASAPKATGTDATPETGTTPVAIAP